jgi:LysR family tcuABC transcriptional regulator
MVTIRQIRSVVAVSEEGSFTRAAKRENATQSGVSQHVAAVEEALGVALFERGPDGVRPTEAGRDYYTRCVGLLRGLEDAADAARAAGRGVSGRVRAGLMPAFTRAALPPALERFAEAYPQVAIEVIEGYSGALTDMVRAGEIDFALVPAFAGGAGLTVTPLTRSREMLVSGAVHGLAHGAPVRLAGLPPLKLIVPTRSNVRRARLDEYLESQGVRVARRLEMDAMLGTLGLVARSDWVTILPQVICAADTPGGGRVISPLADPPLHSDFVVIEPSRRPVSRPGRLFLDALRRELAAPAGDGDGNGGAGAPPPG